MSAETLHDELTDKSYKMLSHSVGHSLKMGKGSVIDILDVLHTIFDSHNKIVEDLRYLHSIELGRTLIQKRIKMGSQRKYADGEFENEDYSYNNAVSRAISKARDLSNTLGHEKIQPKSLLLGLLEVYKEIYEEELLPLDKILDEIVIN